MLFYLETHYGTIANGNNLPWEQRFLHKNMLIRVEDTKILSRICIPLPRIEPDILTSSWSNEFSAEKTKDFPRKQRAMGSNTK